MVVRRHLPKAATAPAQARRLLDPLADKLEAERFHDARLLVSEVVANAVEHVDDSGEIEVRVHVKPDRLRIEVIDPGTGFTPAARDPRDHRGWGLELVRRLSDDWGVVADPNGRVWFELTA